MSEKIYKILFCKKKLKNPFKTSWKSSGNRKPFEWLPGVV